MILLRNVCKSYATRAGMRSILEGVNLTVNRGDQVGILGRNGAGKSTLVRLVGGVERPTSGTIQRSMSVSWPLAFAGAFQTALTGMDNIRFICRVYGVNAEEKVDFIEEFSELGNYLREPMRSYSSGMRARLAFAISMVVEFDCFLVDEVIAVGDTRFHEKCLIELFEKRADRAKVIVSHDAHYVKSHCDKAAVLKNGKLVMFDDMDDAYFYYSEQ